MDLECAKGEWAMSHEWMGGLEWTKGDLGVKMCHEWMGLHFNSDFSSLRNDHQQSYAPLSMGVCQTCHTGLFALKDEKRPTHVTR